MRGSGSACYRRIRHIKSTFAKKVIGPHTTGFSVQQNSARIASAANRQRSQRVGQMSQTLLLPGADGALRAPVLQAATADSKERSNFLKCQAR
jgi:hypothetical protein